MAAKTMGSTPTMTSVFVVKAGDRVIYEGPIYADARRAKRDARVPTVTHRVNIDTSPP